MKNRGQIFNGGIVLLPEAILFIGLIIFIGGGVQYAHSKKNATIASNSSDNISPTLMERKLAIEQAMKDGRKEYSYTTNFIPGLGRISDPEAYKKQWEETTKKQLEQAN